MRVGRQTADSRYLSAVWTPGRNTGPMKGSSGTGIGPVETVAKTVLAALFNAVDDGPRPPTGAVKNDERLVFQRLGQNPELLT